jgi:hypothetical protein
MANLKLQTLVADSPCRVGISYEDRILLLGSCFTDNIGAMLKNYGFNVCCNPFGTLYNPASILNSVRRLKEMALFSEEDCIEIGAGDNRICSFSHHTSFARQTKEEFIEHANASCAKASEFFRSCNKIIITLGTSWCYRHLEKDIIVSNCLKRNPKEFARELLTVNDVENILKEIMDLCPDKEFIFTVSPIRHFKDGAHGNQLSKSTLLLGIHQAIKDSRSDYFPSYEIMMDELRDYRFYAEDMCHPSQQAVSYIGERFLDWGLPGKEQERLKENIRTFRHGCHISK